MSLHLFQNVIFISYCHSKIFYLHHSFQKFVSYIFVTSLPCIVVTRRDHIDSIIQLIVLENFLTVCMTMLFSKRSASWNQGRIFIVLSDWFPILRDQVILLRLSSILISKSVIQVYSDEVYFTPFYKSLVQSVHFTVSCSSLLRELPLSNSTNGRCIIRLDQQVVFLEMFRSPDTTKFVLREKNMQKSLY